MKKHISFLLSLALLLSLLAACQPSGEEPAPASDQPSASDLPSEQPSESAPVAAEGLSCADVLFATWGVLDIKLAEAEVYSGFSEDSSSEQMAAYIEGAYGLEGDLEDAAIARETGASAVEMAVLRFTDEDTAAHGYECLSSYLHKREGDFTGYAPDQAKLVANAALVNQGQYVGLFIVKNSTLARQTFAEIIETGKLPEVGPEPEQVDDVSELLEILLSKCEVWGEDISNVEWVDGDKVSSILEEDYGLANLGWSEAAIARGADGSIFEIAVVRAADGQEPWEIADALVKYLDAREEEYARFPVQAELLSQAVAGNPQNSSLVIMAVCGGANEIMWEAAHRVGATGYSSAQRHWEESKPDITCDPNYPERVLFTAPNKEDMSIYDTSAIRAAWEKGDPAGLSDADRAVYDAAKEILGEALRDSMTDLEKETAIFTWLVNSVDYDWRHQDIMAETPRTSYQPYGGLVDRAAVCLGYATGFQLLCDLSGIECITVTGACFNSEEDHAWNMVRLDGTWYCVDVTWDANGREQLGEGYAWKYFNVTSDEMAKNHQWDYANTPEATA